MTVHCESEGFIATITLDRPPVNAFDGPQLEALASAVDQALAVPGARAVVLRASGERSFSAGADLKAVTVIAQGHGLGSWTELAHSTLDKIETARIPFVAALELPAVGGGFELALACHFRVISAGAYVALPEVDRGYLPSWGAVERLRRLVGVGVLMDLVLTGRQVPASEALELGLVHRVASDSSDSSGSSGALKAANALAARLAELPPLAVTAALGQVALLERPRAELRRQEYADLERLLQTHDTMEGLLAFFEKRTPRFQGR